MAETETKAAWNLSGPLIEQISYLLQTASLNYRRGNIQESYFDSDEIRILIHSFLSKKEDRQMDSLGKKICHINNIINNIKPIIENGKLNKKMFKEYLNLKEKHADFVRDYRLLVNELLGKYGLGMAEKQDSSRMF